MPPPLKIDKEAVRVLVVAIGPRAAARELGIPEATVLAWSNRGGWLEKVKEMREIAATRVQERQEARGIVQSVAIKCPAQALADVMADDSRETRISLSRASRRLAKDAESADLDQAADVLTVARTAALVHGWADPAASGGTVINIALLGAPPESQ